MILACPGVKSPAQWRLCDLLVCRCGLGSSFSAHLWDLLYETYMNSKI